MLGTRGGLSQDQEDILVRGCIGSDNDIMAFIVFVNDLLLQHHLVQSLLEGNLVVTLDGTKTDFALTSQGKNILLKTHGAVDTDT